MARNVCIKINVDGKLQNNCVKVYANGELLRKFGGTRAKVCKCKYRARNMKNTEKIVYPEPWHREKPKTEWYEVLHWIVLGLYTICAATVMIITTLPW
jgi:hypothetical protein